MTAGAVHVGDEADFHAYLGIVGIVLRGAMTAALVVLVVNTRRMREFSRKSCAWMARNTCTHAIRSVRAHSARGDQGRIDIVYPAGPGCKAKFRYTKPANRVGWAYQVSGAHFAHSLALERLP
ncbi:hypothetical protein BTHE68_61320 (plasmid) [Burkholderia sp. THE68]|nr:hypothetical protein BTHE68_61320 [Burkholderia sp. THE68]